MTNGLFLALVVRDLAGRGGTGNGATVPPYDERRRREGGAAGRSRSPLTIGDREAQVLHDARCPPHLG